MDRFVTFTGKAMPLPVRDVDTDMIIPAQYLTSVSREGYGANLFRRLRDEQSDFPLNQQRFKGSSILIADSNFGCGSSREHAVWALKGAGFRAVIAKSFADIFSSNSSKNGLLLIELSDETVDIFLDKAKSETLKLTIDLAFQTVSDESLGEWSFQYDPFRKHCLLNGLDDIDYILSLKSEIKEYRAREDKQRFYSTVSPNRSLQGGNR